MNSELTLRQLVQLYPQHKEIDHDYFCHLRSRVYAFCDWAMPILKVAHSERSCDVMVADISPQLEQAWVFELKSRNKAALTVRGYIRNLRTIVNFEKELSEGKVTLPKVILETPDGFTIKQIKRLVKFGKKQKGCMKNGVKWKDFWPSAIYTAYSIAVRSGDMFRIRKDAIPKSRRLHWVQHKTGLPVTLRFSRKAIKAIKRHGHDMAVPWCYSRTWFEEKFEELRNEAGIDRGTWKWLRRSAGSYADEDGQGHKLLGNSRAIFEKHYRVPEIAGDEPPKQVAI